VAGSIREKSKGVWELRVYLGRDDRGRVQHKSRTFRGGKREAERALTRLVADGERERIVDPAGGGRPGMPRWGRGTTLNDAIRGWRDNGWDDLSPTTTERYEQIWRMYIADGLGRRRIASISPYEVEQFFRELKSQGVGRRTMQQMRAILHRSCRLARKWSGNELPNPVADTELPEWSFNERAISVRAPTADEVRALLAAADSRDRRLAAFVRLTAATGARRGELCALRWSGIDWNASCVQIEEAVIAVRGGTALKGPKTQASVRRVAIDAGSLEAVTRLRAEREAIAADCEVELAADGFVFSTEPTGTTPPHPEPMTHSFRRLRAVAGVDKDIHLHSLRHFQATELDTVISEAQKQARLGWSTVHMARHYTDAIRTEDRRAADHIGSLLGEVSADSERPHPQPRSPVRYATTSPSRNRSTARLGMQ
jgi:integrase